MGNLLEKYDIDRITLTTKKPLQDDEEKNKLAGGAIINSG